MYAPTAAQPAKQWLTKAARQLRTSDPVGQLAPFIDESLALPPGDRAYRRPHTFETRFSERQPRHLELGMSVGDPLGPPQARVEGATRAMRHIVHNNFGGDALRWLEGRADPLRHQLGEAWVASGFDHDGLRQAQVTYSWGPGTEQSLSVPIYDAVHRAIEAMPVLTPALTAIRCGRSQGSQEISFRIDGALRLDDLRPLMDAFGLGMQHTRLTNMLAFVLGARFTLPPDTALITLRPTPAGIELRLDVDLERIPDVPPNVASLLQLQLVERPQSLAALEQWVVAMTPDGHISPGGLSVLSIVVRPNSGPRLAIDLRPSIVAEEPDAAPPAAERAPDAPARPVGARSVSPWDPRP